MAYKVMLTRLDKSEPRIGYTIDEPTPKVGKVIEVRHDGQAIRARVTFVVKRPPDRVHAEEVEEK